MFLSWLAKWRFYHISPWIVYFLCCLGKFAINSDAPLCPGFGNNCFFRGTSTYSPGHRELSSGHLCCVTDIIVYAFNRNNTWSFWDEGWKRVGTCPDVGVSWRTTSQMSGGEVLGEKLFISFSNIEQLEKAITLVHLAAVHHLAPAAVKLLHVKLKQLR